MSFRTYKDKIDEGDTVILYLSNNLYAFDVHKEIKNKKGDMVENVFQTPFGALKVKNLIGTEYGSKVELSKGWGHVLQPTPELWSLTLPHRTQIIYTPDISMILLQLDLVPGSVVIEAGTGSGSLTHALVRRVRPHGHVYTFDFHEHRANVAREEFKEHGVADFVTAQHRDVLERGFGEELKGKADAVFLDLPSPWAGVPHALEAIKDKELIPHVLNLVNKSPPPFINARPITSSDIKQNRADREQEAVVMKANPWLYHYYAVQSKLHYGLAYEAASRMYGPPPPDVPVYPPTMQYTAPPVCVNGNQVMMPSPSLQTHIPHVPPHLTPMHYAYERPDNVPVDYSVSLQDNRYHNIRVEDTRVQPNAKRKAKSTDEKPNTPVPNMSPRCTPSTVTSGDTLVAVSAGSIASRRPGSKNFNIAETEMVDQWNPSPTWSESALQKVPDVCHQDLSPYVTTTPPTPSGTPTAYTHNYSHTFVFDWSPEQYVPHTNNNNRCNTVTTESSYQQAWERSQRSSFAGNAEGSVDENCNPNRLSLPVRVSNPPPAYSASREGEVLRRQIDRPHPDSPDAKKPAL